MQTKKSVQCHGLSPEEVRKIQRANAIGEKPEMISGNVEKDTEIKSYEAHLVHVRLEKREFDRSTGKKTSNPFIQSFYPNEFDKMVKDNLFFGLQVDVVHDPRKDEGKTQNDESPSLDKLKVDELKTKYFELFGEEPDKELKKADLIAEISERLQFLEDEKNNK
jgi:hypothetical protein